MDDRDLVANATQLSPTFDKAQKIRQLAKARNITLQQGASPEKQALAGRFRALIVPRQIRRRAIRPRCLRMRSLFSTSPDALPLIPPLLGRAISPLPLPPLEFVLNGFLDRILSRNPQIFDRLGPHAGKRFAIKPTDLPFIFVIEAAAQRPCLSVVRELSADADAQISSSMANLLALVEGRLDGDALMFSRQLAIEGDVEAVLALRNAIDDARLDMAAEIGGLFGPLGEPVRRLLGAARDAILRSAQLQDRLS
ncbi:ubiquinone anaerobic biosynthesis accessory factor UbiT [Bradyrhizobium sp. HKCCYLS1011]|uniref:ubiquinone anaerobic biosynthesis accessory factor UbiT n=1 Tax=Bradyrhizobium sp. HKCCYLS1011 TaxID=3420733 RepID=UPI003EBE6839